MKIRLRASLYRLCIVLGVLLSGCSSGLYHQDLDLDQLMSVEFAEDMRLDDLFESMSFPDRVHTKDGIMWSGSGLEDNRHFYVSLRVYYFSDPRPASALYESSLKTWGDQTYLGLAPVQQSWGSGLERFCYSHIKRQVGDASFLGRRFKLRTGSSSLLVQRKNWVILMDESSDIGLGTVKQRVIDELVHSVNVAGSVGE